MSKDIVVIAHNIRSTHNIGSLLRTADGLGITKVYLTGFTPHPQQPNDERLPHIAAKIQRQIHKTALGAETSVNTQYHEHVSDVISRLKQKGYHVVALEQSANSVKLPDFLAPNKTAILLGNEVEGVDQQTLADVDTVVEIPMFGKKESFNVIEAASMLLYHCRFVV